MNEVFNIFALKYLLSERLPVALGSIPGASDARFAATKPPEDAKTFFSGVPNPTDYIKYIESTVRIQVRKVGHTPPIVFYAFFRNGRNARPDLGSRRYDWTKPSSIELGVVDSSGVFRPFYKAHYHEFYPPDLRCATVEDNKKRLNMLTAKIITEVVNKASSL